MSLQVDPGAFLVLPGGSGCGKTTPPTMIDRLINPTSGSIEVDGREGGDVDPVTLRRQIGYVFQGVGF